ncbi:MAG: hypothetical protein M2R45_01473 [Verrucomicrobia subdivision 3 bacterium]|nr:hypothetical protein [Limisphaerales bacterium]MCS1413397.1 hypothetical protein [Limisphaerales bacterium]
MSSEYFVGLASLLASMDWDDPAGRILEVE